ARVLRSGRVLGGSAAVSGQPASPCLPEPAAAPQQAGPIRPLTAPLHAIAGTNPLPNTSPGPNRGQQPELLLARGRGAARPAQLQKGSIRALPVICLQVV